MNKYIDCLYNYDSSVKDTLKHTSYDDSNGVYMISDVFSHSKDNAINFDSVKKVFCSRFQVSNKSFKSVDAIIFNKKMNKIIFLEFKNGNISKKKEKELKYKLKDSLHIFNDITSSNLDFCRKNCEYIVVYNIDKNSNKESPNYIISKGYQLFIDNMQNLSGEELIHFNLSMIKKICVNDVHTYDLNNFIKYYSDNCI